MPLSAGDKLGPYEILAPLGAGGMGEVYRGRDTKLDREVAIKVLPAALAQDPERLARFEREAKALAALNHANIAQIYGVEESGGVRGLVMELVPGSILKGPLPLETALHYAKQIAEALEAAHEKGITHRDLKPANVMVTPEGAIKVLDFGLASTPSREGSSDPASSPTMTMATQAGLIMGTAAYMSPEQAAGKVVDKRSDIWSFGVVLFQMLTGRPLFEGETVSHTLADVLRAPIDLAKLPATTPAPIRDLLARCLDRDVKLRLRDIGEARVAIQKYLADPTSASQEPAQARSSLVWRIAAGALALVAAGAGFGWWRAAQHVEEPLVRLDVDLGQEIALAPANGTSTVIISPDGTRLAFLASSVRETSGGQWKLFIRRLDQLKSIELSGTEGANSVFFSPDSQWVGFAVGGKLNKISVEGGTPVALGDIGASTGSSWGEDGSIVSVALSSDLVKTPSGGGAAVSIASLVHGEYTFIAPQILPGGKSLLYSVYPEARNSPDVARIEMLSLIDHSRTVLAKGGNSARYLATSTQSGYVVYANRSTLYAVPFELGHTEKRGAPVAVLDDVGFNPGTYESQFDVSRNGTMVYRKPAPSAKRLTIIQSVDANGKRMALLSKPNSYASARVSPDGTKVVADLEEGGDKDIQVYDLHRETWTPLTLGMKRLFLDPVWTPDGQSVIFGSLTGLFRARADGASQPQPLTQKQSVQSPEALAPDGKRLIYIDGDGSVGELWTVTLDSSGNQWKAGSPEQVSKQFREGVSQGAGAAAFSPDGKWLAYRANSSGDGNVYVRAFPDTGGLWKISNNGGRHPIWSRDEHDLLYQAGDQMMAVRYSVNGGTFVGEKPRVWLEKVGGTAYDLFPDGKRLLVLAPVDLPGAPQVDHEVVLIQNFFDYLRKHVPAGK